MEEGKKGQEEGGEGKRESPFPPFYICTKTGRKTILKISPVLSYPSILLSFFLYIPLSP